MTSSDSHTDCTDCPLVPHRRTFLGHISATVGAIVVSLGLSANAARALAVASETLVPLDQDRDAAGADTKSYPIPSADGVQIDRDNKVILVRWLDTVYAFSITCPHQNTALTWIAREEHFQCPKHRSEYSPDGYFITGRATRGMDRHAIRRDGNNVVVDLTVIKKQTDDEPAWKAACVELPSTPAPAPAPSR